VGWAGCVRDDMENLGLSQKDAQLGMSGKGELRSHLANPVSPGKMDVKNGMCMCVCRAAKATA